MTRLLGISGSLRAGSYNTALLHAAAELLPTGVELEVATVHGIPLYDGDAEEKDGIPAAVEALKDKLAACDGLVLCTPEYNHSVPGVLKNAIDWMSRPGADKERVFGGRPVALLGASPSGFGTVLAQNAWLPVFRILGMRYWCGRELMVSGAHKVFDDQGKLQDETVRDLLRKHMAGFTDFVRG
ncbi:NADPH-dependent FMN reductase [Arenimonas sp.]|uniref:NADPH-dependent FMN reductase n=1 Tax=Arenimonas sp. TaxID=1872635 RepID=UPI0035B46D68